MRIGLLSTLLVLAAAIAVHLDGRHDPDLLLGTCSSVRLPFSAANPPPPCWRPYADDSPFNTRIAPGARTHPRSAAVTGALGAPQAVTPGAEEDYDRPVFWSAPEDPEFTLRCLEPWGECDVEGHRIRVPDAARPATGADAHLTVIDQEEGWEYDLWGVRSKPRGGGELRFRWGGRTRIDGDGLRSDAVAARFGTYAGLVRAAELDAGRIDHALLVAVRCDDGTFVPPATKSGLRCVSGLEAAPPMGARFQLEMSSAEIDALRVDPRVRTLLRAMAEYGLVVGDTGTGSWSVFLESSLSATSFGLPDPFGFERLELAPAVDWRRRLRMVAP